MLAIVVMRNMTTQLMTHITRIVIFFLPLVLFFCFSHSLNSSSCDFSSLSYHTDVNIYYFHLSETPNDLSPLVTSALMDELWRLLFLTSGKKRIHMKRYQNGQVKMPQTGLLVFSRVSPQEWSPLSRVPISAPASMQRSKSETRAVFPLFPLSFSFLFFFF